MKFKQTPKFSKNKNKEEISDIHGVYGSKFQGLPYLSGKRQNYDIYRSTGDMFQELETTVTVVSVVKILEKYFIKNEGY